MEGYDKSAKKIIIPEGTEFIPDYAFKDYKNLEEIIIPDSVIQIGRCAFEGCNKLKKITLSKNLRILENYSFCNCQSLEEITIPKSLQYFSKGLFKNCKSLKKVNIESQINYIDDFAFSGCEKLEKLPITEDTSSFGTCAFRNCDSIEEIHIGKNVDNIEDGAFSLMHSLKKITVDKDNENFESVDDDTILINDKGSILQYAIANTKENVVVGYYSKSYGTYKNFDEEIPMNSYELIYNIRDYAFAGSKYLKSIDINSELESIGPKTFFECPNLKTLNIFHSSYGDKLLIHVHKSFNEESHIPFKEINIDEGIITLCGNQGEIFKNATEINLPESLVEINNSVFDKATKVKELRMPKNIQVIGPNNFCNDTTIIFNELGKIKAKDINMLQTKINETYYLNPSDTKRKILSLKDGTYYVKINDYDIIKINKDEIRSLSPTSHYLEKDPDELALYVMELLRMNGEYDRLLSNIWTNEKLENLFNKFAFESKTVEKISQIKLSKIMKEIVDNHDKEDEFLFSANIIKRVKKEDLIKLIENYNLSIKRFFKYSEFLEDERLTLNVDKLIKYCNLLEKYQVYDRFLYKHSFALNLSYEDQELLVRNYNKNIKHLLKNSNTVDDVYGANLQDLFKLCKVLGVFSNNKILSQKVTTFLNEKIINDKVENGITDNNIHSIFNEIVPKEKLNYEFIEFFITNYKELLNLEKETSGLIAKIYNAFENISKVSTSHRGSQRHLKVTIDKCTDYFLTKDFDNVTEKNKELANLLRKFYLEGYVLGIAEKILKQSESAPRNIFTKVTYTSEGVPIYSYDAKEDLKEENTNDFSYEWLPKQDYNNLILGKLCNCCAHILGAGAGIMRASIILDNCQNLVIRNEEGKIIAKMTIYVYKDKGYAIINTSEINLNYLDEENLKKVYNAFLRGVNAFVDKYNENNSIKLNQVNMGEYRNELKNLLGNKEMPLMESPNYSTYGYFAEGKSVGTYNGDSHQKQILVLKK